MRFYIPDTGYLKTDKNNVVANSIMATRSNPHVTHTFYNLPVMCIAFSLSMRVAISSMTQAPT